MLYSGTDILQDRQDQYSNSLTLPFSPLGSHCSQRCRCGVAGLRVEASPNLFVENLHSTRRLETTYYVTDVKQQTDFFWYRESGIRVNIGLQNVNLVPLYEDVEHLADNSFVTGSPHSDDDKAWFDDVTRRHCRCAPRASLSARGRRKNGRFESKR